MFLTPDASPGAAASIMASDDLREVMGKDCGSIHSRAVSSLVGELGRWARSAPRRLRCGADVSRSEALRPQ